MLIVCIIFMGLFSWGDDDGREHQLAENADDDSVTPKRLTTAKTGWGKGRHFLNDEPVVELIEEDEQPQFLFASDLTWGHIIQRETSTDIEPDGKYRVILLVTNTQIRFLCGNKSGDIVQRISYGDITKVGYQETSIEPLIGSKSYYGIIKIATENEAYYFRSKEYYKDGMKDAAEYAIDKCNLADGDIETEFSFPETEYEKTQREGQEAIDDFDKRLEEAATLNENNNSTSSSQGSTKHHNSTQSVSRDYPSDWNKRRKQVYKRDDYMCQNCGSMGGPRGNVELHAHHVVPKSRGGTHRTSNLVSLCKQCHNTVHSKSKQAPVSHQQPTEMTPQYGDVSDAIVMDIATVIDTMASVLDFVDSPDISLRKKADEIEEVAIELRPFIMEITDGIEILDTLPSSNYPSEVIVHDREFMDHSADVMLLSLEWLETRSNQLNNVVTHIYSCPDCGRSVNIDEEDFCADCGAELKLGISCPSCGEDVLGSDRFCSSCGECLNDVEEKTSVEEKIEQVKEGDKDFDDLTPKLEELNEMFEKRMEIINKNS